VSLLDLFQVSVSDVPHDHGHLEQPTHVSGGVIVVVLIVAAVVVLGVFLLPQRLTRQRRRLFVTMSSSLVVAVAAALAVAANGQDPARPPAPGTPLLQTLELSGQQVPVMVVPNRPGFNLVAVAAPQASAGPGQDRLTTGDRRPGSTRTWIPVELPRGPSQLWVSAGGTPAALDVDTGDNRPALAALPGSDGPECASAIAGALLAGSTQPPATCPADSLPAQDAAALRSIVRFLAGRGERTVALVGDDSPRGSAAAAEVRAAAQREGVSVATPGASRYPVIIVAGWAGAEATLKSVETGQVAAQGTYLAPWLLTPSLLRQSASQVIALRYTPRDQVTADYLAAMAQRIPGELPSSAGYESWRQARGQAATDPVRLYAASVIYVPGTGGSSGHEHHATAADWLPDGMIIPVTGPLT
jgi:hypothetical protein